jgi:hypothetical protein
VLKVAPLSSVGDNAAVVLESTTSLADDRATFYYVRLVNVGFDELANVQDLDRLSLVLSTASMSTIELSDPILVIEQVASVEFPFNITAVDGIDNIQAAAFVEDQTIIATASFGQQQQPSIPDSDNSTSSTLPPILESTLTGSYGTQGTIRIDYSNEFVNGEVKAVPRLNFDLPNTVSAPGPYLYLSKRPFSETRGRRLDAEDIYIPLDQSGGSFNVAGTFDQLLDEVPLEDIKEYANGSWVVWCRPFGVYIGGGSISAAT